MLGLSDLSESCLTDPYFCMEDHQMPELPSGGEMLEEMVSQDEAKDHRDTCDPIGSQFSGVEDHLMCWNQ